MDERILLCLRHPFKSLFVLLYKFKILKKPKLLKIKLPFNKKMFILMPEHVSQGIYLRGVHEADSTEAISRIIKKGMCVIDIGAHFGYFSLLLSKLVGSSGIVHSFEPTKSTFNILYKNCRNEKNIKLNNIAVYSKNKELEFYDLGVLNSAFNSSKTPKLGLNHVKETYKINSTSLDSYFRSKKKKPEFIKIDAECAELDILKGMKNTLKKAKPILLIEVGDINGNLLGMKCVFLLKKLGYKPYKFRHNQFIRQQLKERCPRGNLIFFPHSRRK